MLFDTSLYSKQQQPAEYPTPQPDWELIQTQDRAIEVIESLMDSSPLGIDLETTGLHPRDNSKGGEYPRIRLLQIASTPDFCYIFDLFYLDVGQLPLNQLFRGRRKIAHNFKFETLWLKSIGVEIRAPLFCTFLAAQLIENGKHERNNGNKESPYSLRSVARKYAQRTIPKEQQRSDWSKWELSVEQLEYAARDAAILLEIREAQLEPLKSNGLIQVAQLEFRAIPAFAQMEYEGVLLDWERLEGIRQGAIAKLEPAKQEFLEALDGEIGLEKDIFGGFSFNPRSNEQLVSAFQKAGIPVRDVRKESLEPLAGEYPLVEKYLDYHRIETQIADIEKYYPSKARKHIPWDSATGKIYPKYWQIGTISGRASSKEPNIQNPPKGEFRECVVPESGGRKFVVADYSQAHPRVVARISGDHAFTKVFQEGECCYSYEASALTGKPIEQIKREHKEKTSNDRNDAKPVVLGFIYGLSPGGYIKQVQGKHSEAFARKARNQFFRTHPEVGNWHEKIQRKLDISAIATTQSGRIVELKGRNRRFNFAVNFPVLGTEADMMKTAMGSMVEEFDQLPYKVSLKIMIHDEIVVECPQGREEEVSQILDRVMKQASDRFISPIPAKVDIESGDCWVKP